MKNIRININIFVEKLSLESERNFDVFGAVDAEIIGLDQHQYETRDYLDFTVEPPYYQEGTNKPKLGSWIQGTWEVAHNKAEIRAVFFENLGCDPVLNEVVQVHADRAKPYTFCTREELLCLKPYGKTLYR